MSSTDLDWVATSIQVILRSVSPAYPRRLWETGMKKIYKLKLHPGKTEVLLIMERYDPKQWGILCSSGFSSVVKLHSPWNRRFVAWGCSWNLLNKQEAVVARGIFRKPQVVCLLWSFLERRALTTVLQAWHQNLELAKLVRPGPSKYFFKGQNWPGKNSVPLPFTDRAKLGIPWLSSRDFVD